MRSLIFVGIGMGVASAAAGAAALRPGREVPLKAQTERPGDEVREGAPAFGG